MKNFIKDGQKLPLYGIGPYIVGGMAGVTIVFIVLFSYILKIGILNSPWDLIFRIIGGILIALGLLIWAIGALGSGMDKNISENELKTDGVYAWVRNPMYSGLWMLFFGIGLMWHNVFLLITPVINWGIMTVVLKRTEEKWLLDLYGDKYRQYLRYVNRCIPWKRK